MSPPALSGSITDVAGIEVGHSTDTRRPTGCTVVLARAGALGAVDVRGSAPGTRETDLLSPTHHIAAVHAVVLAGGSAFGLDCASGVVRWLEENGIGFDTGYARVPIVPAAILFDLAVGPASIRPDAESGYQAIRAASSRPPAQGNEGAGAGATCGKLFGFERAMKGGIGSASVRAGGFTVGAIVAVNAVGDIVDPCSGRLLAGARTADGTALLDCRRAILAGDIPPRMAAGTATTIGVIATDAILTKAQAGKVAQMGHDGLARSINPVHTMFDGDTLFALATGTTGRHGDPTLIGILGAEAVARAVVAATLAARSLPGLPAHADFVAGR